MPWTYHISQVSPLSDEEQTKFVLGGGTGIYRHAGFGSKSAALDALANATPILPLGFQVRIEKRYHMKRGYEPKAAFRPGDAAESWRFELTDHGAWYDPKIGGVRAPKWKMLERLSRPSSGHSLWTTPTGRRG